MDKLETELSAIGKTTRNPFLLRAEIDSMKLTLFPDARAIISGTEDISVAKSIYARYVGN